MTTPLRLCILDSTSIYAPERSQEYFEEIDNHLAIEVLEKAKNIDDYMSLVGLKHYDGHIPCITTRVVEGKGLIVAYRKLAREGNTTEEQTLIHILFGTSKQGLEP